MVRDFGREDVAEMLEFAERLRELSRNDWKDIASAVRVMVAIDPPENLMDAAAEERFAATNVIAGIMLGHDMLGRLEKVSDAEAEEITKHETTKEEASPRRYREAMSEFTALTMRILLRQMRIPPTEQELADAREVIECWIREGHSSFLFEELYVAACPPLTPRALDQAMAAMVEEGNLTFEFLDGEENHVRYETTDESQ